MSETARLRKKLKELLMVKAEFNKIIYLISHYKQSIAVTVISVVLGLIIALLDLELNSV